MNRKANLPRGLRLWNWALVLAVLVALAACGKSDTTTTSSTTSSTPASAAPTVSMGFPSSLTGGTSTTTTTALGRMVTREGGPQCNFVGSGSGDPFRNGYIMTKFLVGNVSVWMCVTDFLVTTVNQLIASGQVPTDGTILTMPADPTDPGGPTALAISVDSTTQTTFKMYFNNDTTTAPIYFSWNVNNGTTQGRLILAASVFNDPTSLDYDPEAPTDLRLDLDYGATTQKANMFLAFGTGNGWANGFRINATKALADSSFVLSGMMDMKKQWDKTYTYADLPSLKMYAVSDSAGTGAARASMVDIGWSFYPVDSDNDNLGAFLFTKDDLYYFTSAGAKEYIRKSVTTATYKGSKSIGAGGGITSDASVDFILNSAGYYTGPQYATCTAAAGTSGQSCLDFLDGVFSKGDFGAEANYGTTEPTDGRKTAMAAPVYPTQVYPDGATSWTGVFDQVFTPTN